MEVSRFCKELVVSEVVLVHHYGTDNTFVQFGTVSFDPRVELIHAAAHAGSGAEDEDIAQALQRGGDGLEEGVRIRFFFSVRNVRRIVRVTERFLRENAQGLAAVTVGAENAGFMVVDHEQPRRVLLVDCGGYWF